jgi:ribosomal protein L36
MKTRNLIGKKKSANPHWLHAVVRLPVEAIHVCTKLVAILPSRYETERREVLVSAYDDKCAIVRRKGCLRYVADLKEIEPK